jgi:hypothetical protein
MIAPLMVAMVVMVSECRLFACWYIDLQSRSRDTRVARMSDDEDAGWYCTTIWLIKEGALTLF